MGLISRNGYFSAATQVVDDAILFESEESKTAFRTWFQRESKSIGTGSGNQSKVVDTRLESRNYGKTTH
jgi:hypothetical protein